MWFHSDGGKWHAIHDLLHGARDVVWQGHCFIIVFLLQDTKQNSWVHWDLFSHVWLLFKCFQRRFLYWGKSAHPRVSKIPVFPHLVFFSQRFTLSDVPGIDIRYYFKFFWLHIFTGKKLLTPKALRLLFLIYLQV